MPRFFVVSEQVKFCTSCGSALGFGCWVDNVVQWGDLVRYGNNCRSHGRTQVFYPLQVEPDGQTPAV